MFENLTPDQVNNLISAGSGLLGAVIGAGATLLSTWMARKMQMSGKVTLHIKNVFSTSDVHHPCGYYASQEKSGLYMEVPVWLDVCNTCGVSKVIRNVSLHAYYQHKEVAEFTQIQATTNGGNRISLGESEAYTVVVPENSARRFQMEFMLHDQDLSADSKEFDELILTYFDEKNKIHAFHFMDIDQCWIKGQLDVPRQWITLDRRCKYAR